MSFPKGANLVNGSFHGNSESDMGFTSSSDEVDPFLNMPSDLVCMLTNITCDDEETRLPFDVWYIKVIFILLYSLVFACGFVGKCI